MNKIQKKIVKPDGNDFHYRVKRVLDAAGWNVRMSPYYNDSFSEKPREIDIIAEKFFPSRPDSIYAGGVIVRLFVECKYVPEKTIFWFDKKNISKAKKVVNAMRTFHDPDNNYLVAQGHHYLADALIAKLYRTHGKNKEGDPIYKAITQCLNATIYFRHHPTDLREKHDHQTLAELNYPFIICNSFENFSGKDTINDIEHLVPEYFQLEVDYAYTAQEKQLEELFYIDVLDIDKFENFESNVLSKEVDLAKQKLSDDKREAEFEKRKSEQENDNFFTNTY